MNEFWQNTLLFSPSVLFHSLWLQHTRFPCPSISPGVCSNSYPRSRWCHPIISSSLIPFSSCFQSFPASGYFSLSWLFPSGGQSIGASASVFSVNIRGRFPLRLTGLISLLPKELSEVFSSTIVWRWQFYGALSSLQSSSHKHAWSLGRPEPWFYGYLSAMSLLFNTLSRFVVTFLSRRNCHLISWMQSPSALILEPKKRKSVTSSTFSSSICHGMGSDAIILVILRDGIAPPVRA